MAMLFGGAVLFVFLINLARKRTTATTKPARKLSTGRRVIDIVVRILIVLLVQSFMCEKMVPKLFYDAVHLVVIDRKSVV